MTVLLSKLEYHNIPKGRTNRRMEGHHDRLVDE